MISETSSRAYVLRRTCHKAESLVNKACGKLFLRAGKDLSETNLDDGFQVAAFV